MAAPGVSRRQSHEDQSHDVLPDQVLVSVLELVPRHSVLASVALVNKRWLRVATSKDLWASKMSPALSSCCLGMGVASWGATYFAVYLTNLLANPYLVPPLQPAQPGLAPGSWVVTLQGGSGWAWEAQPNMGKATGMGGSSPVPPPTLPGHAVTMPAPYPPYFGKAGQRPRVERPCAMASSYRWCELVQVVDLLGELARRGLSPEAAAAFLDSSPPLSFSVWYAGREDCPAECEARILLTGASCYTPAQPGLSGDAAPGELPAHLANSAARLWGWTTGCVQPGRGGWHRARCVVAGYPPGARRAVVVLRGRDRRFWRGHYGAKLCAPSLHFLSPEDLGAAGEPGAPGAPEA